MTAMSAMGARWYQDACGTAHALELIGERWALLVVRELMFGPRRFGQLRASLPGISASILTQRLAGLENDGVLRRHKLPPPASVHVYELTPWGYEAEPMIQAMGRWATRSKDHDPSLPLSGASLMLSFRTMLSAERAGDLAAAIGFRFSEEAFTAQLERGTLSIRRAEPERVAVTLLSDPTTIAAIVYGGRPIAEAVARRALRIEGDARTLARFVTLFPLPPKDAG